MSTFVPRVTIDVAQKGTRSVKLLDGLIAGATPYHHTVEAGGSVDFFTGELLPHHAADFWRGGI